MLTSTSTSKNKKDKQKYPCLMSYTNDEGEKITVLLSSPSQGVALESNADSKIGDHSSFWDRYGLEPFFGSVTLTQE